MSGVIIFEICMFQVDLNVPVPEVGEEQVMVRVVVAGINPVETYIREGGMTFGQPAIPPPFCVFRSVQQVARAALHTWHRCCWFCPSDWEESVQHQGSQPIKWFSNIKGISHSD